MNCVLWNVLVRVETTLRQGYQFVHHLLYLLQNYFMKYIFAILSACALFTCNAQKHSIEKIWETDNIVAVPESVLLDINKNILYVSLIDGGGWDADGKGGVGKLETNGQGYDSTWITGLNAPKGME